MIKTLVMGNIGLRKRKMRLGRVHWYTETDGSVLRGALLALAAMLFSACADPLTPPETVQPRHDSGAGSDGASVSKDGGWKVSRERDPMDNSTTVYVALDAIEHARLFPPPRKLVILCRRNKTTFYVVTHEPVRTNMDSWSDLSRTRVRYKIDGAPAVSEYWSESTDLTAIFSRSPIAFARKLASAKELLFEYSPHGSVERILRFDVSGLANVLPEVASQCNWKFDPPVTLVKPEPADSQSQADRIRGLIANASHEEKVSILQSLPEKELPRFATEAKPVLSNPGQYKMNVIRLDSTKVFEGAQTWWYDPNPARSLGSGSLTVSVFFDNPTAWLVSGFLFELTDRECDLSGAKKNLFLIPLPTLHHGREVALYVFDVELPADHPAVVSPGTLCGTILGTW